MQKPRRKRIPLKSRTLFAIKKAREFLIETGTNRLPIDPFLYFERFGWLIFKWSELVSEENPDPLFLKKQRSDARALHIDQDGNSVFIVVYDDTIKTQGRILFTIAHEIGHIVLGHLTEFVETAMNRGGIESHQYKVLEREADEFAAELLSPIFVLKAIGSVTPEEIASLCSLSALAATHRSKYIMALNHNRNIPDLCIHFSEFITGYSLEITAASAEFIPQGAVINIAIIRKMSTFQVNSNGRLEMCPRCHHDKFKDHDKYCTRCGESLFNCCTNNNPFDPCGINLSGDDRHCGMCGEPSWLFSEGYLTNWEDDENQVTLFDIDI